MLPIALLCDVFISGFAMAGGVGALCYGWARQRWQPFTLFALMSFVISLYALWTFALAASSQPEAAQVPIRFGEVLTSIFMFLLPLLYCSLCGKKPSWPEVLMGTFYLVALTLALMRPYGYEWDLVDRMDTLNRVGTGEVHYVHGVHSKVVLLIRIGHLLVTSYCLTMAWRGWRTGANSFWAVLVLPLSLLGVSLFVLGDTVGWCRFTFDVALWSATALYSGLGACIVQGERALLMERDRTEEALRASEERYRQLFENMTTGFALHEIICDSTGNPNNYRYLEINPAFEAQTGLNSQDLLGNTVLDVLPNTEAYWIEVFGRVALTGEPTSFEDYSVELGKYFSTWVFSPRSCQFAVIFSDVTDRRKVEEALRKSERRLTLDMAELQIARQKLMESEEHHRLLVQNAPDAIVVVDPHLGTFVEHNHAAEQLFGLTSEALKQIGPADISPLYQPDGALSVDLILKHIETVHQGGSPRFEWIHLHKSGKEIPCEIWLTRIPNGGQFLVRASVTDISHRKNLEAQLIQSQKMEAIGRLAGGVAHDFNNLLTVITGYCQLIRAELEEKSPLWNDASRILQTAERATDLTRQLLAFSRKQEHRPHILSPSDALTSLAPILRRLIGEDIELTIQIEPEIGSIRVDPTNMEQVLLNLVINSRDAMPTGGTIQIEVTSRELTEDDAREHVDVKPGHYVVFTVRDTGCGMDQETLSHIFEPFFTTKGPQEGTGLGLATVYGIVTQSQGHIRVESEQGVGTSIYVLLPRSPSDQKLSPSEDIVPVDLKGTATILLTEDDVAIRELAGRILRSHGYTVLEAAHGEEALLIDAHYRGSIHLLLTDAVMPRMNGQRLSEKIVQTRPEVKVILMSGYADDAMVRYGILSANIQFLEKPFTQSELLTKVQEALRN